MNIKQSYQYFSSLILILCMMLIYGCSQLKGSESVDLDLVHSQSEVECLHPLATFEFPIGGIRNYEKLPFRNHVPPSGSWIKEIKLPEGFRFLRRNNLIASPENSIWLTGEIDWEPVVVRYEITSGKWIIYDNIDGNQAFVPVKLFLSRNGAIWGINLDETSVRHKSSLFVQVLSRYDKSTDQFLFVEDQDYLFRKIYSYPYIRRVREDKDGNLLFLIVHEDNEGIYRFNPRSHEAQLLLVLPQDYWIVDFVATSGNNLWMVDAHSDNFLIRYDMNTKDLQHYKGTFSFRPGDDLIYDKTDRAIGQHVLLLDDRENLWVDDRGWLEGLESAFPRWHRVIRSSLFVVITTGADGYPFYYWARPKDVYQSSDGLIWFTSEAGVIRLNSHNGEWCLFTTYYSPVYEDQDHNLWLVAGDHLYRLDIWDK